MTELNNWTTQKKASQLLVLQQRQAVNIPTEVRYKDIIEALEGWCRDHCSQLE
jgi:hypothetical protein